MTPDSSSRSAVPLNDLMRRAPRRAVLFGALGLLMAVALVAWRPEKATAPGQAGQSASPGASPPAGAPRAAAPGSPAPDGAEPQPEGATRFDAPPCWEDLGQFNDTVTLETFRAWAVPLLASRDPLVLDYLKGRLAELIGADEGRAREVLDWAREASPAEFKVLMGGLRGSPALKRPAVAARLTSLGLDDSIDMGRRAGFLDELQHLERLEAPVLADLARFAKDPASGEAGWVTTRSIGRVMKEDLARNGNVKPYVDQLLSIGTESPDEQVRYLALEMEMHAGAPLDSKAVEKLERILSTEGSGDVRQVAAHDLSLAEDKAQALKVFAQRFATEQELCVRWALFRFAARTAGRDALPVMAEMALKDPRFQGDYQDFERLYASGINDFNTLWLSLPTQDPHGCLHVEE